MKLLLLLFLPYIAIQGCKPVDHHESRAKTDDSEKQLEQGIPGTKLLNLTRFIRPSWAEVDDGAELPEVTSWPVAISFVVRKRNALHKIVDFFKSAAITHLDHGDTQIDLHIKDLRHNHLDKKPRKVTLVYKKTLKYFNGKNKFGMYSFTFHKDTRTTAWLQNPNLVGRLSYRPKNTKRGYYAHIALNTSSESIVISDQMWNLMSGKASKTEKHPSDNRYVTNLNERCAGQMTAVKGSYYTIKHGGPSRIFGFNTLFANGTLNPSTMLCSDIEDGFKITTSNLSIPMTDDMASVYIASSDGHASGVTAVAIAFSGSIMTIDTK